MFAHQNQAPDHDVHTSHSGRTMPIIFSEKGRGEGQLHTLILWDATPQTQCCKRMCMRLSLSLPRSLSLCACVCVCVVNIYVPLYECVRAHAHASVRVMFRT